MEAVLHWAGLDDAEGGDDEDGDAEEGKCVEAQHGYHLFNTVYVFLRKAINLAAVHLEATSIF